MQKVQDGDLSKMSLLFERHHRDLFGYFFRQTNDAAKSEDLVQDVFYRLLKYRHTYRGDGKFIYWMYSVAKNTLIGSMRKKKLVDKGDNEKEVARQADPERNAEDLLIASERKQLLRRAMQELSPEKKEAIVLSKFQGLKYQEIAQLSNCTENTIKSRVHRGLMDLKEILLKLEIQ